MARYLLSLAVFAFVMAVGMGWIAWETHSRATKAEVELERVLRAQRETVELARKADAAIAEARRSVGGLDASTCESALGSIRRALQEQR